MSTSLRHRGPEDEGIWADPTTGIAFGHRRLSIIDLSPMGHQPMHSSCGRYVITFNGEIYNFKALRQELEQLGEKFRGHSDTEIMLAGDRPLGRRDFPQEVQRHVRVWPVGPRRANLIFVARSSG